ncbi:hypothetical protein ACWEK5_38155 [Rhodococcus koreensis]
MGEPVASRVGADSFTYATLETWSSRVVPGSSIWASSLATVSDDQAFDSIPWAWLRRGGEVWAILVPLNKSVKVPGVAAIDEVLGGLSIDDVQLTVHFVSRIGRHRRRQREPDGFCIDDDPRAPIVIVMTSGSTERRRFVYPVVGCLE